MARVRIYVRVKIEIKAEVQEHANKLGLNLNEFMTQALQAHIGRYDALQEVKAAEQQVL